MRAIHYEDTLRLRVPKGLPDALRLAAKQRHTTLSDCARQMLLAALENAGVRLRGDGGVEMAEAIAAAASAQWHSRD